MNASTATIHLKINGEIRAVPNGQSLSEVIASLGLLPQTALVEHNGQALLRSEWAGQPLADGDQLEILRIVAGG